MIHFGPSNGTLQLIVAGAQDLYRLEGYWKGADGLYLQVHDAATTAAVATATLVRSYYLQSAFPFSWSLLNDGLSVKNGLCIAVSSNADPIQYTAYGGSATDLSVELDLSATQMVNPAEMSVAGDLTTGTDSLLVWTTGNGPKRLYEVDVVNNTGAVAYLCVFAKAPSDGDIPLMNFKLPATTDLTILRFGESGLQTQQQIGTTQAAKIVGGSATSGITNAGATVLGCYVAVGLAGADGNFPGTYMEPGTALNYIRAYYQDSPMATPTTLVQQV